MQKNRLVVSGPVFAVLWVAIWLVAPQVARAAPATPAAPAAPATPAAPAAPAARAAPAAPAAPAVRSKTLPTRPAAAQEGGILAKRLQRFALPRQTDTYEERTSEVKQVQANKIFQLGNRKFEKRQLDDAIRHYRKAYSIWPHPIILYNMAINLGFLSDPLAAALKFRKVLQYKAGPISGQRYTEAAKHYKRLMGKLAILRVVCAEPGVKIFVDGKPFGTAPLDKTVTVLPGRHMVSASKNAKVPYSAALSMMDGYHYRLRVRLKDFTDVVKTKLVPRYHWYVPTIATSVAALALSIGGGLWGSGAGTISTLKKELTDAGFDPQLGTPISHDQTREDRAVALQYAGQVLVGVGLTAVAAAVVLWVLRNKKVRYTVEVSPTKGGAGVNFRF
jgi:hypothetical protein